MCAVFWLTSISRDSCLFPQVLALPIHKSSEAKSACPWPSDVFLNFTNYHTPPNQRWESQASRIHMKQNIAFSRDMDQATMYHIVRNNITKALSAQVNGDVNFNFGGMLHAIVQISYIDPW